MLGRSSRSLLHNKQKKLGFDTRRRLLWRQDRREVCWSLRNSWRVKKSNQSEHHRGTFGKEHQGAESKNTLERERGMLYQHDPRHVDVLFESLKLENGTTVQTPIVGHAKDETSSEAGPDQTSKYRSHVARCLFFSHDRADITFAVNELCQRMTGPTQQSFAKVTRSVFEGREAMDPSFRIRGHQFRSDSLLRLRLVR